MARIARVVVAGYPHHITQRGNRRQRTFFADRDYRTYIDVIGEWCGRYGVKIWAYCLMPNHIHMIGVPNNVESLARAIGESHRRYTRYMNFRKGWRGYLWQGRFASFPMDERYLLAAVRYVELNPVRARLVRKANDYKWSSASAHITGKEDLLISKEPLRSMIADWEKFLGQGLRGEEIKLLRRHSMTGRPLGDKTFISKLEDICGRILRPGKPGPKVKNN